MLVRLWSRDLLIDDESVRKMQDRILSTISKSRDERESVSYMVDDVRFSTKLRFPTKTVDAETMFEALGFTLVREKNGSGSTLRTYVTL